MSTDDIERWKGEDIDAQAAKDVAREAACEAQLASPHSGPTLPSLMQELLNNFGDRLRTDLREEMQGVGKRLQGDISQTIKEALKDVQPRMNGAAYNGMDAPGRNGSDCFDSFSARPAGLKLGSGPAMHPSYPSSPSTNGGPRKSVAARTAGTTRRKQQVTKYDEDSDDELGLKHPGLRGTALGSPSAPLPLRGDINPPEAPPMLTVDHGLAEDGVGGDEAAGGPGRILTQDAVPLPDNTDSSPSKSQPPSPSRGIRTTKRDGARSAMAPTQGIDIKQKKADADAKAAEAGEVEEDAPVDKAETRKSIRSGGTRMNLDIMMSKSKKKKGGKGKALWNMSVAEILKHQKFDNLVGFSILVNAATIGVQTDWNARMQNDEVAPGLEVFEYIFCVWFTTELSMKIYVNGRFLWSPFREGFFWNCFDTLVVSAQLFEMVVAALTPAPEENAEGSFDLSILRILRILRLIRILRVLRVLHLITELRAIVSSIIGSFKSLLWTVVLLLLMIYIVAVYFTQCVTQHIVDGQHLRTSLTSGEVDLENYFGSLGRSILSLWQAMSGGLDWDTLAGPLLDDIGAIQGLLFASYIGFSLLALMNVVTGVFVQTALQSAMKEEDSFMTDQIISLFRLADKDKSSTISWDEVTDSLEDPKTAKEWKNIGVQAESARYLFKLLDLEGNNEVAFDEFLGGCLRLNGQAKSIDLLTVMQENRRREEDGVQNFEIMEELRDVVGGMNKLLHWQANTIERAEQKEYQMWDLFERNFSALRNVGHTIQATQKNLIEVKELVKPMSLLHDLRDLPPGGNEIV